MTPEQIKRLKFLKGKYYIKYVLKPQIIKLASSSPFNTYDLLQSAKRLMNIPDL